MRRAPPPDARSIDRHVDSVPRFVARRSGDVALACGVLDQDDLAGTDVAGLAVAGGDRDPTRQTDHILPAWRAVPAVFVVRGGLAEHDAARRQAFRQSAGGGLLHPVDLDVAEMRLAVGILVQIVNTHGATNSSIYERTLWPHGWSSPDGISRTPHSVARFDHVQPLMVPECSALCVISPISVVRGRIPANPSRRPHSWTGHPSLRLSSARPSSPP